MSKKTSDLKKNEKVYEIWEVLEKFGQYQILQYTYICVPTLFFTMLNINYIFVVGDVGYRCRIPECEGPNATFEVAWWPDEPIDRCRRPLLRNTTGVGQCTADNFTGELEPCTEWIYENMDSVVSELDLACRPWEINSVGTVHNFGMLIAMLITGWISDRFGRKPTVVFCMVSSLVGVFKVFAKTYPVYIFIEFLEALLSGGGYSAATLVMIEITGRKKRILSGVVFAYAIYLGETVFATIAMLFPNWKTLTEIIYLPSILWIALIYLLHESPRWQVLNGKTKEAIINLKRIANSNNIRINAEDLSSLNDKTLREKFNIENYETKEGIREVFKSKEMLKRLLVAAMSRFTSNFVYYGLMVNSVWLPGNKYTNFLLATVMSFPGEMISLYLMNKIGRKLPLIVGFIVCGVVCLISAFVPESASWAKVLLFLSGKVIVSVCFTGAITYSLELFPTSARGSLLGVCAFAARVGGMLAPLTPILNVISEILPAVCFAASAVITGLLIILTPETKWMPLMDTIGQAEASVKVPAYRHGANNPAFTGKSDDVKFQP